MRVLREYSWKMKQCRRFATTISKSNLGIEARTLVREKQAVEDVRKKAGWIAKQVRRLCVRQRGGGVDC